MAVTQLLIPLPQLAVDEVVVNLNQILVVLAVVEEEMQAMEQQLLVPKIRVMRAVVPVRERGVVLVAVAVLVETVELVLEVHNQWKRLALEELESHHL